MTDNTRYSDEVRDTALARVNVGISQRQVARELGIGASTINKWVTVAKLGLTEEQVIQRENSIAAQKEIARLRAEVAFLKKAAAYFAKQQP